MLVMATPSNIKKAFISWLALSLLLVFNCGCGEHVSISRPNESKKTETKPELSETDKVFLLVVSGDVNELRAWLDQGNQVNLSKADGKTLLMEAASWAHEEVVRLLIEYKADISLRDQSGKTALDYADGNQKIIDIINGDEVPVDELSEKMLEAALAGDYREVQKLLDDGAQVNYADADGNTALMISCVTGSEGVFRVVLVHPDTEINARNKDGKTALTLAIEYDRKRMVLFLRKKGGVE